VPAAALALSLVIFQPSDKKSGVCAAIPEMVLAVLEMVLTVADRKSVNVLLLKASTVFSVRNLAPLTHV
jgi:hypothetical protein